MTQCTSWMTFDGTTPVFRCDGVTAHKGKHWHLGNGNTYRWSNQHAWVDARETPVPKRTITIDADELEQAQKLLDLLAVRGVNYYELKRILTSWGP